MRFISVLFIVVTAGLSGCANFKVVSDFAQATKQVTEQVRSEMTFITLTCVQQAGLRSGFELDTEFRRIGQCEGTDKFLRAVQQETVNVMDLYANSLLALIDDKQFDLSGDIETTANKLTAIKTQSGASPVTGDQAGVLGKVLTLITDAWLQREREKGIRMLVDASSQLAEVGNSLSQFFRSPSGNAPYTELIKLSQAEAGAVSAALNSDFIVKADPIRSAEMRLEQWKVTSALNARGQEGASGAGALLAQAIDTWVQSVPVFRAQAFDRDPKVLYERIAAFRAKVIEARSAVDSSF